MTPDSGRALRAAERGEFFPAIIKQFNWICSYAGELVVWISISMPSHKSYFQVHWALSSAKLILHDMPRGLARCFFHAEDTLTDTSEHVPVTLVLYLHTYNLFMMHSHSNKRLEHTQLAKLLHEDKVCRCGDTNPGWLWSHQSTAAHFKLIITPKGNLLQLPWCIWLYLSPIFKEILAEHLLGGVLMIQHLGKEHHHLFCRQAQLYLFTCTQAASLTLRSFLTALNQPSLIVRTIRLSSRTSQEHKPLGARGPLKIHHPVPPPP